MGSDSPITDTSRHGPTARSQRMSFIANICGLLALLDLALGYVVGTRWGGFTDLLYVVLVMGIPLFIAKAQQIRATGEVEFDYRAGPETRMMRIRSTFRKYFTIQVCGTIPIALFLLALAHAAGGDSPIPFVGSAPSPPSVESH